MSSLVASHPDVQPLLSERPQRAKLLEAMVRAVAEKGYEAATVADAVRLARVSRGTFYELFESKEACLAEAYRVGNEVLEQRVSEAARDAADWREELRLGIRAYLQTLDESRCSRGCTCSSGPPSATNASTPCGASPAATARASPAPARRCRRMMRCTCSRPACTSSLARACARARKRSTSRTSWWAAPCGSSARRRAMDLTFNERELAFRDELRAWLAENPAGEPPTGEDDSYAWRRDFQRRWPPGAGRPCTGRASTAVAARR